MPTRRAFLGGVSASLVALPLRAQGDVPQRLLEARAAALRIAPGGDADTACLTYDGVIPGPLLRAKQGEDVLLRLVNKLDQPTSLHWHGLRAQNAADGVAGLTQAPVAPGASFDYRFKAQDAGLFLYQPCGVANVVEQRARGMAGVLIVDEANPPEVDNDLLLVFQDWGLDSKGGFSGAFADPAAAAGAGRIGDHITVNAKAAPLTQRLAPGARARLRLVNACAARIMIFTFEGATPKCFAIDGQACDPFELVRNTVPVAPGARFELMLDMPAEEGAQVRLGVWNGAGAALRPVAAFKAQGARVKERGPFAGVAANAHLPPEIKLDRAKKTELSIEPPEAPGGRWTFNGEPRGFSGKPLFSVKRGAALSFGFANKSEAALSLHIHGHAMRLLHDLDDGWEPYWRNSVIVPKGARKHVALLADTPGKWALRCDIADHEQAGLATWFEVV
ncbi:MAG: multicopper oxidase family protein [Hyphomicrobiales bacterium]|nr:multicopper oxidase family protein [Hyphomicrobiales bacterium]